MAVGEDLQQEFNLSDAQVKEIFKAYMPRLQTAELSEKEFWQELRGRWGIREVNEDERLLARTFITTLEKMPGMYDQRLNVKAEEAIFIDDQEKNVIAAEQLGIQGIVFRNTELVKDRVTQLMA